VSGWRSSAEQCWRMQYDLHLSSARYCDWGAPRDRRATSLPSSSIFSPLPGKFRRGAVRGRIKFSKNDFLLVPRDENPVELRAQNFSVRAQTVTQVGQLLVNQLYLPPFLDFKRRMREFEGVISRMREFEGVKSGCFFIDSTLTRLCDCAPQKQESG
jgi:hypothetical protein